MSQSIRRIGFATVCAILEVAFEVISNIETIAIPLHRTLFHPNITTLDHMYFNSTHFYGSILMKNFKARNIHRIGCEVTFRNVETEYLDFITIRYAGK